MSGTHLLILVAVAALAFAVPALAGEKVEEGKDDPLAAALALVPAAPAPADAPKESALKAGDRIIAIGDSITQAGGYLKLIDAALERACPELKLPPITNAGIGGQKAENLVRRFEKDVLIKKPAVVLISIGINDVWHRVKQPDDPALLKAYRADLAKMVDQAQAAGIRVILLAPTIISEDPEAEGNRRLAAYAGAMRDLAAEKKCGFADLHGLFREALKKKPSELKGNWLTSDGVHMKPPGDALMAVGVLRALGLTDDKIAGPGAK